MAAAVLTATFLAQTPASAQTNIASLQRSAPVTSHGTWVAWSQYDPRTERFRLMRRSGGETVPLPVAGRRVPFDIDLGPDERTGVAAVYSRCRIEPNLGDPRVRQWAAGTPQWSTGRGCDLYKFTFATGRETRIGGASTAGASEFLPTIWKGHVAFARVYTRRAGAAGARAYLYHRSISGRGRSSGLPEPPRAERGRVEPGPSAMDLSGRRLGLAWETNRQGPLSEIDLVTIGGGRRLIERVGSGEIQTVNLVSAGIRAGWLHYGQGNFGDSTSGDLRRFKFSGAEAHETAAASPDRMLLATAPVSGGAYALVSGGVQAGCFPVADIEGETVIRAPCALDRVAPVAWRSYAPRRFRLR